MSWTPLVCTGLVLVVLVLGTAVRRVPREQAMVVVRRDVVRRIFGPGLAWRIPGLERWEPQLAFDHDLPLGVRATSRDGVPVLLLMELTVRVPPPEAGDVYADPWPAAERAAESVIADAASAWTVGDLPDAAAVAVRPLLRPVQAATREHGVESLGIDLVEINVSLSDGAGARGPG